MSIRQITFSQFVEEAGPDQAVSVVKLWEDPALTHLVLFGDSMGQQLAVLPIGPDQAYTSLDSALRAHIEGLWARAWTYSLASLWAVWSESMVDMSSVEAREADVERREHELKARTTELAPRLAELEARERFTAASENHLATLAQQLTERQVELEQLAADIQERKNRLDQREAELDKKEQIFFRQAGNPPAPKAVPASGR